MIDSELIRRVAQATRTKETRQREVLKKNQHSFAHTVSMYQNAAGLRGYWPLSGSDSTGAATDFGNLAHHLAYNGNPTYNYDGLLPYVDLDGTGDYLAHGDHADFDIAGTETTIANSKRGLSLYGVFYVGSLAANQLAIGKSTTAPATSQYDVLLLATGFFRWRVSNGAAFVSVTSTLTVSIGNWYILQCRYIPSTSLQITVLSSITTQTDQQLAGVPAAIPNSAAQFTIGAGSGGVIPMTGRASHCAIAAMQHDDAFQKTLREQTRAMVGI